MRWVEKTRVTLFRLSFSTGGKKFDWTPQSENSVEKAPFDWVRKPDLGFSRKGRF